MVRVVAAQEYWYVLQVRAWEPVRWKRSEVSAYALAQEEAQIPVLEAFACDALASEKDAAVVGIADIAVLHAVAAHVVA